MLFDIAETLHLPLYKLLNEMTYEEFLGWVEYFKRRPKGWRDDYRAYVMLRTKGLKDADALFPSLEGILQENKTAQPVKDQVATKNLMKSAFFTKINSAVGGENIFKEK